MPKKTIKGFMTFRDGEPLSSNSISYHDYTIYKDKAPLWQKGDKSVEVLITYNLKKDN